MSLVTSVVVFCQEDIEKVKAFEWQRRSGLVDRTDLAEVSKDAGGSKVFHGRLYAGGFNFFPAWDFIEHLESVEWTFPDEVVVTIQQEDCPVTVWTPKAGEL